MGIATISNQLPAEVRFPGWLLPDLRSDHAGEVGAIAIYSGALAAARGHPLRGLIIDHLRTERRHLAVLQAILPPENRSRILPFWRFTGWVLGFVSCLFGARVFHITVVAVGSFANHHYGAQIRRLREAGRYRELQRTLDALRRDEMRHSNEAAKRLSSGCGPAARAWGALVSGGSAAAVAVARRV